MTMTQLDAKSNLCDATSPRTIKIATEFGRGVFSEVFEESISNPNVTFTKND